MTFPPETIARFLSRISPEPNSGCWLWTGDYHSNGYGQLEKHMRPRRAHRFAYEAFVGPIPDGLVIDHKCQVRCCVNPDHLEPVTSGENTRRGVQRIRFKTPKPRARKTHCKRGHELSGDNLRPFDLARGRHACRKCHLITTAALRLRKKALA